MSALIRPAEIVLPILRAAGLKMVDLDEVEYPATVNTWIPDIDFRKFPLIQIRRMGGTNDPKHPTLLTTPVIEMTAYTKAPEGGLQETEQLYNDALFALYEAKRKQTQTPAGYLHSVFETMGATQFSSPFQDSWRVQGLIQLGIRPPRSA